MRSQTELLRRDKSLSHTWIVTTMSLHTMSVIFIDWAQGLDLAAQRANDRTVKMTAFANKSLALLSATQG
jgi:hypothetical protein